MRRVWQPPHCTCATRGTCMMVLQTAHRTLCAPRGYDSSRRQPVHVTREVVVSPCPRGGGVAGPPMSPPGSCCVCGRGTRVVWLHRWHMTCDAPAGYMSSVLQPPHTICAVALGPPLLKGDDMTARKRRRQARAAAPGAASAAGTVASAVAAPRPRLLPLLLMLLLLPPPPPLLLLARPPALDAAMARNVLCLRLCGSGPHCGPAGRVLP
mmetsp:Transcript_32077/g.95799  ORF Transcript_32077/g.95799 Transcript_32077/m.95799 type:complete len:210 (-) Transcript_32077:323-952(-)